MRREEFQIAAPGRKFLPGTLSSFPVVSPCGSTCGSDRKLENKTCKKVAETREDRRIQMIPAVLWWRLLDSNQWPHACEYSIGRATTYFPLYPGPLCPDFIISVFCSLHWFHSDFSCCGSICGSSGAVTPPLKCSHNTLSAPGYHVQQRPK